jgi:hypothetical protein
LGDSTGPQICQEDDEEAEQEKVAWTWGNMKKVERLSKSSIPEARLRLRNMIFFEPVTLPTRANRGLTVAQGSSLMSEYKCSRFAAAPVGMK